MQPVNKNKNLSQATTQKSEKKKKSAIKSNEKKKQIKRETEIFAASMIILAFTRRKPFRKRF